MQRGWLDDIERRLIVARGDLYLARAAVTIPGVTQGLRYHIRAALRLAEQRVEKLERERERREGILCKR